MIQKRLTIFLISSLACSIAVALVATFLGHNKTVQNINSLFELTKGLMTLLANFGDFLLAAVLVLYLRKYKVIGYLLAAAGVVYLFGCSADLMIKGLSTLPPEHPFSSTCKVFYSALSLDVTIVKVALPTIVAYKRNKARRKRFLIVNLICGWLPPVWVGMMLFAFKSDKKKESQDDDKNEKVPKTRPVHQRILKKRSRKKK